MYLSRPGENLDEHINEVLKQYAILNKYIDDRVEYIIKKLCNENILLRNYKDIIKKMFIEVFIMHDVGKKNPYFQSFMGNENFIKYKFSNINKYHTQIGAICYIIEIYNKYILIIENRKVQNILKEICICFAYNIYRHHINLEDLDIDIFLEELIQYYKINKEQFINNNITDKDIEILNRFKHRGKINFSNPYTFYMLNKLNYASLIALDYMAVYTYNNKENLYVKKINEGIKEEIKSTFYNDSVVHNIQSYKTNKKIPLSELNKLRTEIFLESEENLIKSKNNSNIFYLEAPTGSGKTLISLNLALNLLDDTIDKIYEVAPYNNIIEQTASTVKKKFYKDTVIVNDNESIFIDNNEDIINPNFDKDLLNYQLLNYPVTLISHVRFFDIFFSNKKSKNLMLPLLNNSIIILDEIQSYKNNIWIHIMNSLKEFADILNIKIIIMSATLPKMDKLLEDKEYIVSNLINNREKYYTFFKRRVDYDFSLLKDSKNNTEDVLNKIDYVISSKNECRILLECLTIKTCNKFYDKLKEYENKGFLVFQITGLTNKKEREYIIKTIQEESYDKYLNNKIILVGTQCIEAGIDIDIDIGFKDISIIDADEQFCGRINRNFKRKGKVYFFDIDEEGYIYKEDYRSDKNLKDLEYRRFFIDKDFNNFYDRNYVWLLKKQSENYNEYKSSLRYLQYNKIHNTMKLINNNTYKFLFKCTYENDISSEDLLKEYINIINNPELKYPEKIIKGSIIKKQLNNYIYNINTYKFKTGIGLQKIYNTYIVEDGYNYFSNINKDFSLNKESNLNVNLFIEQIQLFI